MKKNKHTCAPVGEKSVKINYYLKSDIQKLNAFLFQNGEKRDELSGTQEMKSFNNDLENQSHDKRKIILKHFQPLGMAKDILPQKLFYQSNVSKFR